MKTIVVLALCMLVAAVWAQLYDRRVIGDLGGIDGIGGIGGMDGIRGIGGPFVDNWGVGGGILSTYYPRSYCVNGQCNRLVRHAYYLGRRGYCSGGGY